MKNLYLIDGSGYIFRAFYAVQQQLTTKGGLPTNALFGFSRMLLKLLSQLTTEEDKIPTLVMVFDAARKNFRHDIYAEYKGNRAECPEDLVPQMPYFRKVALALGFPVYEIEGYEADDIIATLVSKLKIEYDSTVIVSADKDLAQLVEGNITAWDPMRDVISDRAKVKENFGVYPEQIGDYLSLVGDASDNIPGAKGVGPKTAVELINHFGTLDKILDNIEEIKDIKGLRGAKSVAEKIESSRELIRLSRKLVELESNVKELDSLTPNPNNLNPWNGFNNELLPNLVEELEFSSLFSTLPKNLTKYLDQTGGNTSTKVEAEKSYVTLKNLAELKNFLSGLKKDSDLSIDTETDSLDPLTTSLVGVSLSYEPLHACYIPFIENRKVQEDFRQEILSYLDQVIKEKTPRLCGSNLKFDIRVLRSHGLEISNTALFDTMIASYVLKPDLRDYGLKSLALKLLGEQMKTYEELVNSQNSLFKGSITEVAESEITNYAAHDADAALRISRILAKQLEDADTNGTQTKFFKEIEMPLVPVLSRMEDAGIFVDANKLEELEITFSKELESLTEEIYKQAGKSFNINSPKQLAVILFEELGLPTFGLKKTQSGFSTDANSLEKLRGKHDIADYLLEYREIHKLNTTYVQGLRKLINKKTQRIHTSFNQAVAATGRLSSSEPNLQNIPIRSKRGKELRKVFVAGPENALISADYSQIELRVLAHLAEDDSMIDAFRRGEDIHQRTAREIFGEDKANSAEASDYRRIAKTINFGVIYGMGSFRLAGDLAVSRQDAQGFIDSYFLRYPNIKTYFDTLTSKAEKQGYVETMFGRRRYLSDLDMEGRDKGYAIRSMMNAPIQGTAAEIVKIAMINIDKRFSSEKIAGNMVLQVHDELIFEVKKSSAKEISEIIKYEMESAANLLVPIVADIMVGNSWGDK